MTTIFLIIGSTWILGKVCKAIKNIALAVLSLVGSLISILILIKLFEKWIIRPCIKAIIFLANKFLMVMQWVGDIMIKHFTYREDDDYWACVATSMDRGIV